MRQRKSKAAPKPAESPAQKLYCVELDARAFAKAKEFLIDLFSYIPKDASDEFIAHQIRLIWDKNYAPNDEGDFFADLNDDIRLSVRANPSPEEIAEARRQKEEVKAKWTNPDGSMKKGYMLAPNGEPTKLSEDQWLIVRTPNFKRWFGDWETLAEYEFLNGKSIRDISTKSVPSGGFAAIREWAAKIFERQGGVAKNSILGDVILDKASVRDSLAHGGANLYKSAAFEVAKDVIEKGYLIFNDVNKGRDSYYFAAPINIDGVPNIVVALVHKYDNDNRFYLHSVGTKESLLGNRVSGLSKDKSSNTSTTYPRDYLQALQNIFNVKPEDVSKVVDENGEPLVVYHRSREAFNIFDEEKIGSASDWGVFGRGFYFSPSDMAQYGAVKYSVFLNIKNPMIIDRDNVGAIRDEVDADRGESFTKRIVEQGYDGVIYKDWEGISEIVALKSTQIKAAANRQELDFAKGMLSVPATDNVGTFSNSPDIRFSVRLNQDDIGKPFEQVRSKIPFSGATPPPAIIKRNLCSFETEARDVEQWLRQHSIVTAFDNRKIRLSVPERDHRNREALPNLLNRAKHLIGFERGFGERQLDEDKLRWVKNIPQTLQTAQARFVSPDAKKLYYVKNYNGILHIVIINKRGSIEGQLITHFPQIQKQPRAFLQEAVLDAINYEGMANLKIGESVPPKRHKEVQTGQTPNLSDRAQYSDFNSESQDKNNPRFSVRANPQKNKKTLALILASDILKSDGKITQEIRNTATRYAPNLSKKDLQEAIDDAKEIALALTQSIDKKAASISNDKFASTASEYFRSKTIENLRKDIFKAMSLSEKSQRLKSKFDTENKRKKAAQDAAARAAADKGYLPDQLLAHDIDIAGAIFDFAQNADSETIAKNIADADFFVKERKNGPAYAPALAQTLLKALMQAARELPYSKSRESAINAINALAKLKTPEAILERANTIAKRLGPRRVQQHLIIIIL